MWTYHITETSTHVGREGQILDQLAYSTDIGMHCLCFAPHPGVMFQPHEILGLGWLWTLYTLLNILLATHVQGLGDELGDSYPWLLNLFTTIPTPYNPHNKRRKRTLHSRVDEKDEMGVIVTITRSPQWKSNSPSNHSFDFSIFSPSSSWISNFVVIVSVRSTIELQVTYKKKSRL